MTNKYGCQDKVLLDWVIHKCTGKQGGHVKLQQRSIYSSTYNKTPAVPKIYRLVALRLLDSCANVSGYGPPLLSL